MQKINYTRQFVSSLHCARVHYLCNVKLKNLKLALLSAIIKLRNNYDYSVLKRNQFYKVLNSLKQYNYFIMKLLSTICLLAVCSAGFAQPRYDMKNIMMEKLNRGVVATKSNGKVAVSSRFDGIDPEKIAADAAKACCDGV